MIETVIKRNGSEVPWDKSKIAVAVDKAFKAVGFHHEGLLPEAIQIADKVEERLNNLDLVRVDIETLQDRVEETIFVAGFFRTAKAYIVYRANRTRIREGKDDLMSAVESIEEATHRDNANVNHSVAGKVLQISEAASKWYYLNRTLPSEHARAHEAGEMYIHDLAWYGKCWNCIQIPLAKLLKNGFGSPLGWCRPAKSIGVAAEHAAIIMQYNQNEMFGGQSYAKFDQDMAEILAIQEDKLRLELIDDLIALGLTDYNLLIFERRIAEKLDRKCYQSMEGFLYNLNFMRSRGGGQIPFTSINFGLGTDKYSRSVAKNLLLAYEAGLGKGEQCIFPNLIFQVKKGVNRDPEDPNYDLYKLAQKVAQTRLFPAFANMDATFNKPYLVNGPVTYMGCRTRIAANVNGPEVSEGRGNIAFVTCDLPGTALEAGSSIPHFMALYEKRIDLMIDHLLERYNFLKNHLVGNDFPFLVGQKLYLGSENVGPEDSVEPALKNGSLTLGFVGLAECLVALTGKHHGASEEARKLGCEIIGMLRRKADEATEKYGLNFSVIATPAESTAGTLLQKDRKKYGIVEGVTDKEYYTNSFHVPVDYKISAHEKISVEAPYHALCNGGHISYVELSEMPRHNGVAMEAVLSHMFDSDMGYVAFNYPADICRECGYRASFDGNCPICGSDNVDRIRRITGYLSDFRNWCQSKQAELKARLSHITPNH